MGRVKKLPIITEKRPRQPQGSLIKLEKNPFIVGQEAESWACGGCRALILQGVSLASVRKKFLPEHELLVQCADCAAINILVVRNV